MLLGPVWTIFCQQEINYFPYSISAAKPNNFQKALYVKNYIFLCVCVYTYIYAYIYINISLNY